MAEAQKLHADVDPIYFSPNFKPMVKLVEILSAEARRAKHTTEDDSDDDTLRTGVRVHALEGVVATLGDLGPAATVRDLRRAVARAVGVAAADQRLYASAAGRLELVKDDGAPSRSVEPSAHPNVVRLIKKVAHGEWLLDVRPLCGDGELFGSGRHLHRARRRTVRLGRLAIVIDTRSSHRGRMILHRPLPQLLLLQRVAD